MTSQKMFIFFNILSICFLGCGSLEENETAETAETAELSVEDLIIKLGDSDSKVALESADNLANIQDVQVIKLVVIPELIKNLSLPDSGNRLKIMTIYTLKKIGEPTVPALVKSLENPAISDDAAEILSSIATADAQKAVAEYEKKKAVKVFEPATKLVAIPPAGSEVDAGSKIVLIFDHPVASVLGAKGSGKTWEITVKDTLILTWKNKNGSEGGPEILNYKLILPDKTAPKISGGNVKNGAKDVDPGPLNERGITLEFSEAVGQGVAELKPEGGEVLGTEAKWEAKKVTLFLLAGRTLANETTYVITLGGVKDGAGNPLEGGKIIFTTKGKE